MELRLLLVLNALAAQVADAHTHPLDPTARQGLNLAALRLLQAPFFEGGHDGLWHLARRDEGPVTLVQRWRDETLWRDPADVYDGQFGRETYQLTDVAETDMDPAIEAAAQQWLAQVQQAHPVLWRRLFEPHPEQLEARKRLSYELISADGLTDRLSTILGQEHTMDSKLRCQGLEYHSAPSWNESDGHYLVAHNGREVAGILRLSALRDWTYGVNYLSVAPAFRNLGVAKEMFVRAVHACKRDGKVMVRTAPGDFARERPAIGAAFDRLCQAGDILYVQSNSRLMSQVGRALEQYSYDQVLAAYKPVCDTFSLASRADRLTDPQCEAAMIQAEAKLAASAAPKRGRAP
jgi:hypothetical protein